MKLALKLVACFLLCICIGVGISAVVIARHELASMEEDLGDRQLMMGRVLRAAFRNTRDEQGQARALALLEVADRRIERVDMAWRALDEISDPSLRARVGAGEIVRTHDASGPRLVTYIPVAAEAGGPAGALVLAEDLARHTSRVAATVRVTALASALAATVAGAIAAAFAVYTVGRPLRLLAAQARLVGAGDFSVTVPVRGKDEVAVLAREMNAMVTKLLESRRLLEEATAARIRALEELRHADRLKTVGTLGSGLAHELGTPLSVLLLRARAIAGGRASGDAAVAAARVIVEQGERMTMLIRRLLEFARRRTPRKTSIDVASVVGGALGLLDSVARKRNVALVFAPSAAPLRVSADAVQLEQVVANLVLNAIQACADGGTVHVRTERVVATPPADLGAVSGAYAQILVEDEGCGIPEDVLPHVFEPFFTTKDVGEGTGLGLSIAYGLVRDHGGWIDVASTAHVGSRFSVYLPTEASS